MRRLMSLTDQLLLELAAMKACEMANPGRISWIHLKEEDRKDWRRVVLDQIDEGRGGQ